MSINDEKPRVILKEFKIMQNIPTIQTILDEVFSLKSYKKKLKIVIIRHNELEMEFDMIGVHPFVANTFRRIMLTDVPTMAIDEVHIMNNTSLLRDEVLAHRIGLVPLKADPRLFEYRPEGATEGSEQDTLEFELNIKCSLNKEAQKESSCPEDIYKNCCVYSKNIKWIPIGAQSSMYKEKDVGPVHDDILLNKMRPGQEIDMKLIATKGTGRTHAKFSPVATASYRILPDIKLTREVYGEQAERLKKCFAPGVIQVKRTGPNGEKQAKVADARYDTCSRNIYRYDDLKDAVILTRIQDHFIFTIESTGALPPDVIFIESIKILQTKVRKILETISDVA